MQEYKDFLEKKKEYSKIDEEDEEEKMDVD